MELDFEAKLDLLSCGDNLRLIMNSMVRHETMKRPEIVTSVFFFDSSASALALCFF